MKAHIEIEIELEYSVGPAEPDVGIMSDYIDGMTVTKTHDDGERMDITNIFTEKEWDKLEEMCWDDKERKEEAYAAEREEYERGMMETLDEDAADFDCYEEDDVDAAFWRLPL